MKAIFLLLSALAFSSAHAATEVSGPHAVEILKTLEAMTGATKVQNLGCSRSFDPDINSVNALCWYEVTAGNIELADNEHSADLVEAFRTAKIQPEVRIDGSYWEYKKVQCSYEADGVKATCSLE